MKKIVWLFFLISCSGFAQGINDYQYVLVPQKFSFQKSNDEFHLNTSTKFLLQKYGFKSFFSSDSIAKNIANENCNKLYAEVEKEGNFLITKVKLILKDCHGKIFFETQYGTSREKEYLVSYNEALRNAFKSFDQLNYKYSGEKAKEVITNNTSPKTTADNTSKAMILIAKPTLDGYLIIDEESKIVMEFKKTSDKKVFIATKKEQSGVVFNKEERWFFEFYKKDKLISEELNLKF